MIFFIKNLLASIPMFLKSNLTPETLENRDETLAKQTNLKSKKCAAN
jgi:hypothetical protein